MQKFDADRELGPFEPARRFRDFQLVAWSTAETKGFHEGRGEGRDDTIVRLALIHTEVSEATQIVKREWTDAPSDELKARFAEELADVVIRVLDLAGCVGIELEEAVLHKLKANALRAFKYGTPEEGKGE